MGLDPETFLTKCAVSSSYVLPILMVEILFTMHEITLDVQAKSDLRYIIKNASGFPM